MTYICVLILEPQPNSLFEQEGESVVDVMSFLSFSLCVLFFFFFLGNYDISSISHVTMSPSRQNNLVSMLSSLPLSKSSYNVISAFCTEDNIPQCISYINQVLNALVYFNIK